MKAINPILLFGMIVIFLGILLLREFNIITPFGAVWVVVIAFVTAFLAFLLTRK